jgi:hypothetical protein
MSVEWTRAESEKMEQKEGRLWQHRLKQFLIIKLEFLFARQHQK